MYSDIVRTVHCVVLLIYTANFTCTINKYIYTSTLVNLYVSTRYRGHHQGARSVGDAAPLKWPVVQYVGKNTSVHLHVC